MSNLTANTFELLLERLGTEPAKCAENYELLRLKLVKSLTWKGCPDSEADALADVALDRVAAKLAQGEQILNINAYAMEVLRFVRLEHIRKHKEFAAGDDLPETAVQPEIELFDEPDIRLRCLRKCLAEVVSNDNDKMLIVGYYDMEAGDKLKDIRKNLAEKLGLTMTTLKVKACRLRERLEKCINGCAAKLTVTKTSNFDTNNRGGEAR